MKAIPLTQGKVALVDDEDYGVLGSVKWQAKRGTRTFYARHNIRSREGKWSDAKMHRVVLERKLGRSLVKGEMPDHENGDGLDNRRSNLRLATKAQNGRNCHRKSVNPSSRYLGVTWDDDAKKWRAQIEVNRKHVGLGRFCTEIAAAQAREVYIGAHPELMARSNFTQHGGTP